MAGPQCTSCFPFPFLTDCGNGKHGKRDRDTHPLLHPIQSCPSNYSINVPSISPITLRGRAPAPSARTVPGSIRHSCGAAAACGRAAWCSHPGGDYAGTRRCASFAQGPPAPPVTRGQGGDRATRIRPPGATGLLFGEVVNPTPSIPPVCGRRWFDSPIDQLWLIVASRFWPFASDTPPAGAPRPATGIVEQPSTVRRPLREAGWEAWRAR